MARKTPIELLEEARLQLHVDLEAKMRELPEWQQLHDLDKTIARMKGENVPTGPVFTRPDTGNQETKSTKSTSFTHRQERTALYDQIRKVVADHIREERKPIRTEDALAIAKRKGFENPTNTADYTWMMAMLGHKGECEGVYIKGRKWWWLKHTPLPAGIKPDQPANKPDEQTEAKE